MYERTDFSLLIHAIAHAKLLRLPRAYCNERLVQAAMHVTSFNRKACLPSIDECSPDRTARCNLHISIIEHDHRIFAAQFQHYRQQPARRSLSYFLSGCDTASKDQLVNPRVDQRRARRAIAGYDLKNLFRSASSMQQLLQLKRHQRSKFRWLQHNRISGNHSRHRLSRRNRKRIIPRRDDPDYAMWLSHDSPGLSFHGQVPMWHRLITQQPVCVFYQEARGIEHDHHFGKQRLNIGLSRFASDETRDIRFFLLHQALKFAQDRNAPSHSELAPLRLRCVRAIHRRMTFRFSSALEFPQNFAFRRIDRSYRSKRDLNFCGHGLAFLREPWRP